MPAGSKRLRWFVIDAIGVLSLVVIVLSIIGFRLRSDLNDARTRLTALEVKDVAENAAARTAEVAACYASARGRPRLIVVLRSIAASIENDAIGRAALVALIDDYQAATPTIVECDRRARDNGLDPDDFPATNRGEEGNGR